MGCVGLGQTSKTMGHLTQSVSIDDVYKLNISYQWIRKCHRRNLTWDPSIGLTYSLCSSQNRMLILSNVYVNFSVSIVLLGWVGLGWVTWVGMGVNLSELGWAGVKMDPRPTLC